MGETANAATCKVCGATIQSSIKKGRPAVYCGTGCRRMAEYDIRRANDVITALENRARDLRNPATLKLSSDAAYAAFLADELVSVRAHLRELLS